MEINYLIMKDASGGTTYLTNQSTSSHYGIPVLQITAEDVDGDFGPADLIGDLDRPETLFPAANIVQSWGRQPERTGDERKAAALYLSQWPEGPQL